MSLRSFLEGRPAAGHECVVSEVRIGGRMVRTGRYKYFRFAGDPVEQLFDLREDPWEMKNLADSAALASEIRAHRKLLDVFEARLDTAPKRS